MSPTWLLSVLVGYVAGVTLAALLLPEAAGWPWWRLLTVTAGLLALALAALFWHRGRHREEARRIPSPRVLWDDLVRAVDRLLDRVLPPAAAPTAVGVPSAAAPSARGLRPRERAGGAPPLAAGLWPVVRLPQRLACMAWLPAGETRSTGRELGRLVRAVTLARDLGFANRATALLVDLDPLVLATAGARSRVSAFVGDPSPPGCTLVPVFPLGADGTPESLPLDLVMDLAAPERLEFGLAADGLAGLEVERLRRLGFAWLMVPARPFLASGPEDGIDPDLMARLEACRRAGIRVVVRDLASERELLEVLDYPVDFATGPLFRPQRVEPVPPPAVAPRRVA